MPCALRSDHFRKIWGLSLAYPGTASLRILMRPVVSCLLRWKAPRKAFVSSLLFFAIVKMIKSETYKHGFEVRLRERCYGAADLLDQRANH